MENFHPFTIDQFYKFISEKKLVAAKCDNCGLLLLPPRQMCNRCLSGEFHWTELKTRGKVLTYTVIHFATKFFETETPYAFGIIELDDGPRLPGIIKNINFEDLKIGLEVEVEFYTLISKEWPYWPKYFFKPAKNASI